MVVVVLLRTLCRCRHKFSLTIIVAVMRTEDASPETTSLVFQGLSVTCLGESCSVCDKKGCHAFDNTSEAFAFFLAQLRYNFFNGFPKKRPFYQILGVSSLLGWR